MDYVVFAAGAEKFGLPADAVAEVLDDIHVRHLAGLPEHVAGVVLHRDAWLPAIDAAVRLGVAGSTTHAAALVIRRGAGGFILLADEVLGIRSWNETRDVVKTDLGLVTPVTLDALVHGELELVTEEGAMSMASATTTIVVFKMGGEEFGTEISSVVEVLEFRVPVHVPGSPTFLEGVIYLRDDIIPVIDLRKRMEMETAVATPDTRYLVILIDGEKVALLVDAVVEVAHLRAAELSEPPPFFRGLSAQYLHGLAKVRERVVIVLQLAQILTSAERITLARAEYKAERMDEDAFVTTLDDDFGKRKKKRK